MLTSLHSMGGRVTPLSDAENTQLWAETLNPGFAELINYDAAQGFDPAFSLAENFWQSEMRGQPTGQGFLLDGWGHLVITLKRLSSETFPAILQRLTSLAFGDVTITTQLQRLPKEQIIADAQKAMDRIQQQLIRKGV